MARFLELDLAGWCDVTLGEFTSRASYLTDVPIDCLEGAISFLEDGVPISVEFDAEGWEFYLESTKSSTKITLCKGDTKVIEFPYITARSIASMIYDDISADPIGWCRFLPLFTSEEYTIYMDKINSLLDRLGKLLEVKP